MTRNPTIQLTAMSPALWFCLDHLPGSCLLLISIRLSAKIMRWIVAASYVLALATLFAHVGLAGQSLGFGGDPNGYDIMVAFFYGVPLALAGLVCSLIAFRKGKTRHCIIPLIVCLVSVLYWPIIFVSEFLS